MTSINILETEDQGDVTKIRVEITYDEIFSVDRERLEAPERVDGYAVGDWHTLLHTNRIEHNHDIRVSKTTLWVENPYTEEKYNLAIKPYVDAFESFDHLEMLKPEHEVQETCIVNGQARKHYHRRNCPSSVTDTLLKSFPDFDLTNIEMISAPAYHEIVQQTVMSAFLRDMDVEAQMDGDTKLVSICRKYCLESGKYYDRCYGFVSEDDTFSFIPDSCTVMAKSYNTNIQEGLTIPDFYDVYFSGDAEVVEAAFDLPHHVGAYRTYYSVTVQNDEVVRAKQYCYDENTLFAEWDKALIRAKQTHNL